MRTETWVAYVDRCNGDREIIDVLDSWEFGNADPDKPRQSRQHRKPTAQTEKQLAVDIYQAAEMLNISPKTVRREIARGKIKGIRVGRVWRVTTKELNRYLERSRPC